MENLNVSEMLSDEDITILKVGNIELALEDDIPVPAKRKQESSQSPYFAAFDEMRVKEGKQYGTSFEVMGEQAVNSLRNAASKYAETHSNWFYVTRGGKDEKTQQPTCRIWRVSQDNPSRRKTSKRA